ncbi:MAG: DUF3368 domain-containing protein [Candidatus Poribacteria bacterium]|nr:DUF3368 domain-containing protein [Candidatus Poribacteria bacterium]
MLENPVISNTSPLVGLWTLGHLHLLRDLYAEVLIPEEVQDEFLATGEPAREQALRNAPWIRSVRLTPPLDDTTYPNVIHRGEAAVFDLAKERGARLIILDDLEARRYAKRIGLPTKGTVGVLLDAKKSGFIATIKPLLDRLLANGIHLGTSLVNEALQEAGELD